MPDQPSDCKVTVVIPCRHNTKPFQTMASLQKQNIGAFNVLIVDDKNNGASWARNEGFKHVKTEFVLFSDDDIDWEPNAFSILLKTLEDHPEASYSYGAYLMNGGIFCNRPFDPEALKKNNYISTMSLIRSDHFVGFDETLLRLQDWDLWLTMLLQYNRIGVYCGKIIYSTYLNPNGISGYNSVINYKKAERIVMDKHGI